MSNIIECVTLLYRFKDQFKIFPFALQVWLENDTKLRKDKKIFMADRSCTLNIKNTSEIGS